jgi:hypothetical protein
MAAGDLVEVAEFLPGGEADLCADPHIIAGGVPHL